MWQCWGADVAPISRYLCLGPWSEIFLHFRPPTRAPMLTHMPVCCYWVISRVCVCGGGGGELFTVTSPARRASIRVGRAPACNTGPALLSRLLSCCQRPPAVATPCARDAHAQAAFGRPCSARDCRGG